MSKYVNPADAYTEWHWGVAPAHIKEWEDPDYPDGPFVECGRLTEIYVHEPGQRKDTIIKLNRTEGNGSHLVFDPAHRYQRLYMFCAPQFCQRMKEKYLRNPRYNFMLMPELARALGGRHGTVDYPKISVVPVGILTNVVYATEKKGDGFSFYIHKLGEESGIRPCLAIDHRGRLWVVAGNYTAPTPGITD